MYSTGVILNKTLVFLQARMGSKRLPKKVLKKIGDRPMISYVVERLRLISGVHDVILLTSSEVQDLELVEWCKKEGVKYFQGSEENVLERYYLASREFVADHYIRATGDNPLVEPYFAGMLLKEHLEGGYDYSSNKSEVKSHLPDGLGIEIFSKHCLEVVYKKSTLPHHFEHVNEYVLENPTEFKIKYFGFENEINDLSSIRLTVDTPEDFEKVSKIISNENFTTSSTLKDLLNFI